MTLTLLLVLFVGAVLGVLGGGGSILVTPVLIYVARMELEHAIGTSLLVVGAASLVALVVHARRGHVDLRAAVSFGAASVATSYVAGRAAKYVPASVLMAGFTVIMLATGAAMLRSAAARNGARRGAGWQTVLAGAAVGAVTGLFGAGGGFLIVPALLWFSGLTAARAVGTSLLLVTVNAAAGFVGHLAHLPETTGATLALVVAASLGSAFGSVWSQRLEPARLRRGFAVLVLLVAASMGVSQLPTLLPHPYISHALATILGGAVALGVVCSWVDSTEART